MAINFPDSPATNDSFTSGGKKWIFNGTVWTLITANSYTIPTGEVTTAKILDANVTAAKLASGAAVTNIGYTPANIASPTFTGTPTLPTGTIATTQTAADSSTKVATTAFVTTADNLKANLANPTFTGTVSGITKSMVGLGSVDNTADTAKPVSTAQQTALNLKSNLSNPTFTNIPIFNAGSLSSTVGSSVTSSRDFATFSNGEILNTQLVKTSAGTDWQTNAWQMQKVVDVTAQTYLRFYPFYMSMGYGTTDFFLIDNSGNLTINGATATKASGTTWANPSDQRTKDNIRDYEKGTAELMQVRVREWEYNGKGGTVEGTKGLGVVADEVMTILPNTVDTYEAKLESDDEENTDIKRFDATEITWLLVKTVQEQQALIENQQAMIQQLTTRLEALES
jgi:hypothetical protein